MEIAAKTLSRLTKFATGNTAGALSALTSNARYTQAASNHQLKRKTELDYDELSTLMTFDEEVALIDVRTPQELSTYGSIPGAINIPLNDIKTALQLSDSEFRDTFMLPKPNKSAKNIIFYARGPNASSAAVEIAHRLGYKGSRQYSGGWEDYCHKTGLPLKKREHRFSEIKKTPFMGRSSFEAYQTFSV